MIQKITRKVISKAAPSEKVPKAEEVSKVSKAEGIDRIKKACFFCQSQVKLGQSKTTPSYTDIATLRRFITDRAKIVSSERNRLCSKHQREVTRQIKYARHLALLPFIPKV